jgi:hypothetical protein
MITCEEDDRWEHILDSMADIIVSPTMVLGFISSVGRLRISELTFLNPSPFYKRHTVYTFNGCNNVKNRSKYLFKKINTRSNQVDRLCGLVVRVLGYRSGGSGSIPGTTKKKSSGSGTGSTQPREYN